MPELPEVQTTVDGLNSKVLKRTFVSVWTDWPKMVKVPATFAEFEKMLKGKKIVRIWRRAKNVVFELSEGYSLLVHMKMTGHLLVGKWRLGHGVWQPVKDGSLRDPMNGFIRLVFMLDKGNMIALSDLRRFAKVELRKTEELQKTFENLGPEPLDKSFTFEQFAALFQNKQGKVKHVLMVPEFIAGIGNIYASEALWWAKINPEKNVAKLTRPELQQLYQAIKKVLQAGIDFGGDSFSDYRDVNGEQGKFEGQKKVYQREGQPCFRCQQNIVRLPINGRSAFYCPRCQKK